MLEVRNANKIISLDDILYNVRRLQDHTPYFIDRKARNHTKVILDPVNRERLQLIYDQIQTTFTSDTKCKEVIINTANSFERLLSYNLAFYMGYNTRKITQDIIKYIGCHSYDEDGEEYASYCSCEKMPSKITKKGISHVKYDSDGDDDFANHFYAVPRTKVIGIAIIKSS